MRVPKETERDEISNPLESKLQEQDNSKDANRQNTSNMMRRSVNLQASDGRGGEGQIKTPIWK